MIAATKLLSAIAAVFALSITAYPHPLAKTQTSKKK